MKNQVVTAGNNDEKSRSDCFVALELTGSGGIEIELNSKVNTLYGQSIRGLCLELMEYFGIRHARLKMEDRGALPFVIAARIEAAVKQLLNTDLDYLPKLAESNRYYTPFDLMRISRLYLPGNTPSLMINAGIHKPSGIILDLEDAVGIGKKAEARFLVRNALRSVDFMGAERMVRINQLPKGLDDLEFIVPHDVNLVLIPKCESADQVRQVNEKIFSVQKQAGNEYTVWLMPIIESALGVVRAYDIASSAKNIVALAIGLEDYTADLGVARTNEGQESLFARSQLVNACKAAGIQAIDSVFSDVGDMEALKQNVLRSKALGFDGMGCIHPRQIKVIHENFAPTDKQIDSAMKIVLAYIDAEKKGLGVVSIGTKMIDAPVVKKARRTIEMAISLGILSSEWQAGDLN